MFIIFFLALSEVIDGGDVEIWAALLIAGFCLVSIVIVYIVVVMYL
jgi:hypothetical protein